MGPAPCNQHDDMFAASLVIPELGQALTHFICNGRSTGERVHGVGTWNLELGTRNAELGKENPG